MGIIITKYFEITYYFNDSNDDILSETSICNICYHYIGYFNVQMFQEKVLQQKNKTYPALPLENCPERY